MPTQLHLPARPPFSLRAVTHSHGWVQLSPFELQDDGAFRYVDLLGSGQVVALQVEEADGGVRVEVEVPLSTAEQAEVAAKVTWMLGLDHEFSNFYAQARPEPKLAHAEAAGRGRVLRCPTLFEDTVKTILTTNTSWAGTKRMVRSLVEQFGPPSPGASSRRAFPTPERLATTDEATLRSATRLGYRAPYVLALSQAVVAGEVDLEALKDANLPTEDLRKRLLAIKGIGGYAAANLLMLLGRHDFIPIDSWALKMVSHEWHDGAPVGPADVEAAFERWGAWKGLAFWFWDWSYREG